MFDFGINEDLAALYKAQDEAEDVVPCTNDPDLFFPERHQGNRGAIIEIRAACATCPIVAQCAEYGIKHEPEFGFWGGLSVEQREEIRGYRKRTTRQVA